MTVPETARKMTIQGPGLKKPGIVVFQFILISLSCYLELRFRGGLGAITGSIICISLFAGVRFGRAGTTYVSVVTPPLALAVALLGSVIANDGLKISRVGIDFIASLASVAPFLIAAIAYGWFVYFSDRIKARAPQRKKK